MSEKARELAKALGETALVSSDKGGDVISVGVDQDEIDAAVAPLVAALKKNAATVRKYVEGEDVHTYEATFALTEAMKALEGWKQ